MSEIILVDTSVWIDHLRRASDSLTKLLDEARVVTHPFVIGEIALGNLKNRSAILANLSRLPETPVASDGEVLKFIDAQALAGTGIGYLDAHLLAAAKLTPGVRIWTRDKKLKAAAVSTSLHMTAN